MKYLKLDFKYGGTPLLFMPLATLLGGILGLICLPLYVSYASKEFPFSTVFSFLGILAGIAYSINSYRGQFVLALSMGQTRRSYLAYFILRQTLLFLICYGIMFLFDQLQYVLLLHLLGTKLGNYHTLPLWHFSVIIPSALSYLLLTVFLAVMFMRFGNILFSALCIFGLGFALFWNFLSDPILALINVYPDILKILSILSASFLFLVSLHTASRQQVK